MPRAVLTGRIFGCGGLCNEKGTIVVIQVGAGRTPCPPGNIDESREALNKLWCPISAIECARDVRRQQNFLQLRRNQKFPKAANAGRAWSKAG